MDENINACNTLKYEGLWEDERFKLEKKTMEEGNGGQNDQNSVQTCLKVSKK